MKHFFYRENVEIIIHTVDEILLDIASLPKDSFDMYIMANGSVEKYC